MMTPVQCDKLYAYNVTPKTTTNMLCKEIQKGTLKTLKINQNGILKIVEVTHRKVRKKNKETKKREKKHKTNKKLNLDISIINLYINGLNTPIKGQRLAE